MRKPSSPLDKEYIHGYTTPSSLRVNWCSATAIQRNQESFSHYQQHLFQLIERKKNYHSYGFEKGNYFENIYPIIASNVPFSIRMACCGRRTGWNGSGRCEKWRFCSRCAHAKKMVSLQTYFPVFGHHHFIFLTVSFVGSLRIESRLQMSQILRYWKAIDSAIKHFRDEGRILGAFFVEEIFLKDFLPLQVLPHVHCIFHVESGANEIAKLLRDDMSDFLSDYHDAGGAPLALASSIEARCIRTEPHFANNLQYLTKEINLAEPYNSRVAKLESFEGAAEQLNTEVQMFLQGLITVTQNRQAIRKLGTMHHASNGYIGTTNRKQSRDYVLGYFGEIKAEKQKRRELAKAY